MKQKTQIFCAQLEPSARDSDQPRSLGVERRNAQENEDRSFPCRVDPPLIDTAPNLWGIILAGGEGQRLHSLVHRLRGDSLPKQYVPFIGTRSMLEHTFSRAERLIPPERLLTVVNRDHLKYPEVRRQISRRPRGSIIVQPENKDTGAGILLPLMHIANRSPEAAVAVFPSDHFILQEKLFMRYVHMAHVAVARDPARLLLLGIQPSRTEPEYGHILPGRKLNRSAPLGMCRISNFIEKPTFHLARELVDAGALWNMMVVVFKAKTLLRLLHAEVPDFFRRFQPIWSVLGLPFENALMEQAYRQLKPVSFSRDVLELLARRRPSRLLVLPVRGVYWNDWGSEDRIRETLETIGHLRETEKRL